MKWIRNFCDPPHDQNYQNICWTTTNLTTVTINLLAPELFFFLILAHPVYEMWIKLEPNKLEFETNCIKKNGECVPCLKHSVLVFVE